ncbi:MAG: tail fiber domain-containing protein [Flavobacteriaceae bacterium]
MKKSITLIVALLITISSFAQQGINYKAVIKDGSGNIVANQTIGVQFTVLEDAVTKYVETHTTSSTDANGIVTLNIGEGTPTTGTFGAIDWSKITSLKTEIDIDGGLDNLINLDTTEFKTVPYALNAQNVEGAVKEINDLIDGKSDNDGTNDGSSLFIGKNAGLNDDSTNNANVGIGYEVLKNNLIGDFNTAFGYQALLNNAGSETSALFGSHNTAIGYQALLSNNTGFYNTANGKSSLKSNTTGSYNTATGYNTLIDNIDGDGNVAIGVNTLSSNISGGYNIAIGNNAGRKVIGSNNVFLGYSAGSDTQAGGSTTHEKSSGIFIGYNAGSKELNSNRLYIENSSSLTPLIYGEFDTDFLRINGSQEISSTSGNPFRLTTTSTNNYISYNSAGGYKGYSGIYTGNDDMDFGTGGGNTTGKVHLVTSASPKLTVAANGNVGIGTQNPNRPLHVEGSGRFTSTLNVGNIWVGDYAYLSSAYTNTVSRLIVSTNLVPSAEFAYSLGLSNKRWLAVWALDGTINTSDRRDKTNIASLDYGLNEIMKLEPISFNWKSKPNQDKKLGLIAQDLLKVIPEVVKTHDDVSNKDDLTKTKRVEIDRMGVYYSDLIPVLIKAIQEQQSIIDEQNLRLNSQDLKIKAQVTENSQQTEAIKYLAQRINTLEAANN